jgi:quinol monooxygenase YgiN
MMGLSLTRCDEFIAHRFREGNIQQPVAVDVPEFSPAQPEFQSAIAVRFGLDASPLAGSLTDATLCPWNGHGFLLSYSVLWRSVHPSREAGIAMSEQLTIIAKLRAKPGKEARVRELFSALRGPTHKESGCLYYELHQSLEDPLDFVFYENWASAEHLDAHLKTSHVRETFKEASEILDGPIEISRWAMLA